MNGEPERNPHSGLWVTVVLALTVFYFLGNPWIGALGWKMGYRDGSLFLNWIDRPWNWLEENSPLKRPMLDYAMWCWKLAGAG